LTSAEQLTADGRCKACQQRRKRERYQQQRKEESPDGRIYRKELPTWCYLLEHYLQRPEDVIGDSTRCRHCYRERLRRKSVAKEEREASEASEAAETSSETQDPQTGILMFQLSGVRNGLGLSTYELASLSRIPHYQYERIENLEVKADKDTQYKLVNGVWRAQRQYQRDVVGVVL